MIILDVLLVLAILAGIFLKNWLMIIVVCVLAFGAFGITFYLIRDNDLRFRQRVLEQAVDLGTEYQQYMSQWEYPFVLLSSTLRVVWYNEAFRRLMKYQECTGILSANRSIWKKRTSKQ